MIKKDRRVKHQPSLITTKILETLADFSLDMISLWASIATSGYGASMKQMERRQGELRGKLDDFLNNEPRVDSLLQARKRRSFSSIISKLKKDGLVENKNGRFAITQLGREKLKKLKSYLPARKYNKESSDNITIFMFDVPEKERYMRDWLRRKLGELDFKLVQKSVFVGKVKLPEEFMDDIKRFKIIDYIDVFAVTKRGSLRQIV